GGSRAPSSPRPAYSTSVGLRVSSWPRLLDERGVVSFFVAAPRLLDERRAGGSVVLGTRRRPRWFSPDRQGCGTSIFMTFSVPSTRRARFAVIRISTTPSLPLTTCT